MNVGIEMPNDNPKAKHDALLTLPEKERARQITLWACTFGFNELIPQPIPVDSSEYVRYKSMSPREKEKNVAILDKNQEHIERKYKAISQNVATYKWLCEMLDSLTPGDDQTYMIQIRKRINEFDEFFKKHPVPRVKTETNEYREVVEEMNRDWHESI